MTQNKPSLFSDTDSKVEESNLNFKRYISLFISNWYWFACALFISLSIAYGINRWSEERFTVSSTLLIKADQNTELSNIFPGRNAYKSQQNLNNEIGILKSFKLNYMVMRELHEFYVEYIKVGKRGIVESRMYNTCPFRVDFDSLDYDLIGKKISVRIISNKIYRLNLNDETTENKHFGDTVNINGFKFLINLRDTANFEFDENNSNKYYFFLRSPSDLANQYRKKLSVAPFMEDASLVTLSTTGYIARQEADYLNKLMYVYLQYGLENKNQMALQSLNFIEDQLTVISDSLKQTEQDLEEFKLKNDIIDIGSEGPLLRQKFEQINAEKTDLLIKKIYYEYLKNYVEAKKTETDIISPYFMGISDQPLAGQISQLTLLQNQRRELEMSLDSSTDPAKLIDDKIFTTRKYILENINNGLQNLDDQLNANHRRLLEIENEMQTLTTSEKQMINIQRDYDINNTVYTYLLEKRAEAGIAKASTVPDNRIIDYATSFSSSRIKPKVQQNKMLALVIGLLFPMICIISIDFLNNKIIDKKDIESRTLVPILGYTSHSSSKNELPVLENPGSTLSESFRSVRTNLKYLIKDVSKPVISVTSTITAEGKTFISVNLAVILALSGKKVLLVGLDLRKPRIQKILDIDIKSGISNYLIGMEEFDNIIIKSKIENLWYTHSGPIPPNPAELIESSAMESFIEKAKKQFDFIIVDTPPIAVVTDALLVSSFTDVYLFVIRQRYSSKNTLELIQEIYDTNRLKKMGIIINDVSTSGYYGYGLRYGYSIGYYGYSYGYNYYGDYGEKQGYHRENDTKSL